ncbi:MAG: large subunit ribosomal protein [Gaiellales bacterium]|nr:large subunit ribosomal protein [Gaiellales bacterium]
MATTTDQPTLVRAQVRHLRCSARKARVILDHVRGLSVMQAEATLQFSPRAAARDVLGLLRSATANAKENHDIDRAELVIDHCFADEDRTLKRFKPRARGRASSIHKRMCHVTIVLRHVAVPEQRDISAAQATIAAESRRARTRRVPGAAATTPADVEASAVEETTAEDTGAESTAEPKAAAPKAARKPRAPKAAAEAGESEVAEAKPARKPRAPKAAAETAESETAESGTAESETAEPKAAAPTAPRKKPAAKPTEPAEQAADDAAEKTADEGDS